MNLVEAEGLRRAFGPVTAVDGVDLAVRAGEAYGLVGPDGAGKTTMLRLLVGALRPDAGSVSIAGVDLAARPDAARASIGYLPSASACTATSTCSRTCASSPRSAGSVRRRSRAAPGTAGVRRPRRLRGPPRRSPVGRHEAEAGARLRPGPRAPGPPPRRADRRRGPGDAPGVLAAAGTDPGRGRALVVSTPYMDEAARCTRVGFMHAGRILVEGSPASSRLPWRARSWSWPRAPRGRPGTSRWPTRT